MNDLILIFDADGVIINGKMFSQHLVDDYGITKVKTTLFFTTIFNDCLEGRADLKESIEPFLKDWGWQGSVDEFLKYWFTAEHVVDLELVKLIQELRTKGIRAYVATNQEKYRTEYMKKEMKFQDWFDGVFSSAELGCKKPKESFYEKVVNRLGYEKEVVWFFDDTVANVEAAQKFGINGVHYTELEKFKKLVELEGWLKNRL